MRIEVTSGQLEELDVEGILAFAERVLPRGRGPVGPGLDQRQRFQQLFFSEGIAFETGVGTARHAAGVTALPGDRMVQNNRAKRGVMDQNIASWNRIADWLRHVEGLQQAA